MEWNGCFTTSVPRNSAFSPHTKVLHVFTCWRLVKCSETPQTSFWVQWSRLDASQLRYPETVHSVPKHKFCIFLLVEGWWKTPKHYQTSFWVQWRCFTTLVPRNSTLRLRRKCYIFYLLKVIEMLQNNPKHQFGSNGVEWMLHNFGTPKQCIQTQTQVLHLFTCQRIVQCSEDSQTSLWVQWSRTDASQLRYPETVHSVPKHKFCIFLTVEG
jgi:hypothetical protein